MTTPAPKTTALKVDPIKTLRDYLDARKDHLAKIVRGGLDVERCTRIALASIAKTPKLLECSPASVYDSINKSLQLGLEPGGPLGHSYLVPFKGECILVISYKGLVVLARRSGEIAMVEARVARQGEVFDVDLGTTPVIKHKPKLDGKPGDPIAYYAVITYRSGEKQIDVMSPAEVEAIHQRSPSSTASFSPWKTDFVEMGKKTVVRRLLKMAPLSIELADQLSAEDDADRNAPTLHAIPDEDAPRETRQTRAEAERKVLAERVAEPAEEATVPAGEPERETVPVARGEAPKEEPKAAKPEAPADDPNKGLDEAQQIVDDAEAATDLAELGALRGGYLALEKSGRVATAQLKRVAKALHEAGKRLEKAS